MLMRCAGLLLLVLTWTAVASAQTDYDFLIKGGRVIDGKNGISAVRDVAIKDGKIAAVEPNIPAQRALKTVDVTGLYVTPGLVDMHVHAYHGEIPNGYRKEIAASIRTASRCEAVSRRLPTPAVPGGGTSTISRAGSSTNRGRG